MLSNEHALELAQELAARRSPPEVLGTLDYRAYHLSGKIREFQSAKTGTECGRVLADITVDIARLLYTVEAVCIAYHLEDGVKQVLESYANSPGTQKE